MNGGGFDILEGFCFFSRLVVVGTGSRVTGNHCLNEGKEKGMVLYMSVCVCVSMSMCVCVL